MTVAEIKDEVRKFRDGARRVKETGAQGVEVTASKGYIIHQFLNPATNRRKDDYGGSEWKRFQLLREIVEAVREEVGPDYLFGVRLSAKDYNYLPFWTFRMPPVLPLRHWYMGNEEDVTLEYGKELKKLGVDFLHIDLGFGFINPKGSPSCGYPIEGIRIFANATRHLGAKAWIRAAAVNVAPRWLLGIGWKYDEVPDASFARRFRDAVKLPVIANGGFQRRSDIERALQDDCDLVAIARPLLANPDLMEQFEKGLDTPENACTFCSQCCTRTAVLPLGCYDLTRFGWPDDPLELAQARMEKQILEFSANHSD
jgi:2,4-dienoyl-CoA reductase (NADPH2)